MIGAIINTLQVATMLVVEVGKNPPAITKAQRARKRAAELEAAHRAAIQQQRRMAIVWWSIVAFVVLLLIFELVVS